MKNKRDINIFIISVQKKQLHNTCCRIGYQRLSRGQPEATKRPQRGHKKAPWVAVGLNTSSFGLLPLSQPSADQAWTSPAS